MSTPPPLGPPPGAWPAPVSASGPGGRPPRRTPLGVAIAVFGVLGAVVLAVGVIALVMGRVADMARSEAGTSSSGAPALAEADAGTLGDALDHRHAGVRVDWAAAAHTGDALDEGQRVEDAPGILLVESELGSLLGTGTGITLTPDGLAMTNYHVVEDASEVHVVVADTGRRYSATVLGRDAQHDIAVLDVQADGLETASVSLDEPERGDEVAAVGNGEGQGYLTAVRGELLGTGRSIMAATEGTDDYSRLTGLLQTDADVVPGYSGGPLVDRDGQVVAVTVAASEGTDSAEVDGFAIPVSVGLQVVEQVLSGEETDTVSIGTDGALGIMVSGGPDGVEVMQVDRGSAAAAIGLAEGDVITAIDGVPVDGNASEMSRMVNDHNVGDRITVSWRAVDGTEHSAEAVLQEASVY